MAEGTPLAKQVAKQHKKLIDCPEVRVKQNSRPTCLTMQRMRQGLKLVSTKGLGAKKVESQEDSGWEQELEGVTSVDFKELTNAGHGWMGRSR